MDSFSHFRCAFGTRGGGFNSRSCGKPPISCLSDRGNGRSRSGSFSIWWPNETDRAGVRAWAESLMMFPLLVSFR